MLNLRIRTPTQGSKFQDGPGTEREPETVTAGTESGTGTVHFSWNCTEVPRNPFTRGTVGTEKRNRSNCSTHEPEPNWTVANLKSPKSGKHGFVAKTAFRTAPNRALWVKTAPFLYMAPQGKWGLCFLDFGDFCPVWGRGRTRNAEFTYGTLPALTLWRPASFLEELKGELLNAEPFARPSTGPWSPKFHKKCCGDCWGNCWGKLTPLC